MSEKRPAVMPQAVTEIGQLTTELQQARQEIADLKAKLMEWEEREASVCPEDYSFEEVIAARDARIEELEAGLPVYENTGKRFVPGYQPAYLVVDHADGLPPSVCLRSLWYHHGRWVPMEDEAFLSAWDGRFYSTREAAEAARSTPDGKGGV